jgi:predicted ferric reductase
MSRGLGAPPLIALYFLVGLAPLSFMFVGSQAPPQPFPLVLSVALAFVGLSLMGLQFALVSRVKWLGAPFGIGVLQRFHREMSFVALAFILAHPALLFLDNAAVYLPLLFPPTAPLWAWFGEISALLLLALISLSIWRRRLRISYEAWQLSHGVLAVVVVALALAHVDGVGYYTNGVLRQAIFDLMAASLVAMLIWGRIVSPLIQLRRPWRVVRLQPERARSTTLVIEPEGHEGLSFKPGQFAWVSRWPVAVTQHPFSFSSPSETESDGRVTVTVKALGDWTHNVKSLEPGHRVYLDGPHGEFSMDLYQAPGYVFVAGGVGITPLYSMVSTMCVREDVRPATLFYANRDWENVIFREQLDELALYMPNLEIIYVLQQPPPGWRGATGRIDAGLLRRHLPHKQYQRFEYFICGPETLMDASERALGDIGVPESRIHTERFAPV